MSKDSKYPGGNLSMVHCTDYRVEVLALAKSDLTDRAVIYCHEFTGTDEDGNEVRFAVAMNEQECYAMAAAQLRVVERVNAEVGRRQCERN